MFWLHFTLYKQRRIFEKDTETAVLISFSKSECSAYIAVVLCIALYSLHEQQRLFEKDTKPAVLVSCQCQSQCSAYIAVVICTQATETASRFLPAAARGK